MRAMLLERLANLDRERHPLRLADIRRPEPAAGEVLIAVSACGVCHTELDEIEARTPPPSLPVVPGHEVVGRVAALGAGVTTLSEGDRVGVGWIHSSDGSERENLSDDFVATGRDVNGGYAEFMTVPADYAYPIPDAFTDREAAPLLCAGSVGYRALRLTELENGEVLGLMGFGGSGHLVLQLAKHMFPDSSVFVFARNPEERAFALELGADWAGDIGERPPVAPMAIIDTTPVWRPLIASLWCLAPGGRLVVNAIRKEDADVGMMAGIRYETHLWHEKSLKTVANVTRRDIAEFLPLAAEAGLSVATQTYALEDANRALLDLKYGAVRGAKVLVT